MFWRGYLFNFYKKCNHYTLSNRRTFCNKKKWRVIFFGSDNFSLISLKKVHKEYVNNGIVSKLDIVTNDINNATSRYAIKSNIPYHIWPVTSSVCNSFDLGIVVSFGHLIPERIINRLPLGMLNVHASLLPRWRGAAPIIYSLMNGDTKTGATLMRIKPHHFDIGDIIYQKSVEIKQDTLQTELHTLLAEIGSQLLLKALYNLPKCLEEAQPQNNSDISYAPKIKKSLAVINWNRPAIDIYNLSRALYGVYSLETHFKNYEIKLNKLYLWNDNESLNSIRPPGFFNYVKSKNVIRVWCKDNKCVYFKSIKLKGKREMSALDFSNGYIKHLKEEELYFQSIIPPSNSLIHTEKKFNV